MQEANFKAYQPITSAAQTTQVGIGAIESAQRASQIQSESKIKRLNEIINSTKQIAQSGVELEGMRENAILNNFKFSKTIADNNFETQLNEIDLDPNKSAIEKANAKKILTDNYRTQSQTMVDNLKKNNTFILGQSQMNIGQWEEANNKYFDNLDNKIKSDIVKINQNELKTNVTNSVNNLSSLPSAAAVQRNTQAIINTIQGMGFLGQEEQNKMIQETLSKADKAKFDLNKANFLNTAHEGNPELALQQTRNEIALLRNEKYQPNLSNKGERIEELLNLQNKIQGMVNRQDNIKIVRNLDFPLTTSGEEIQLRIQNTPEYKEAAKNGDIEKINELENLGRQTEKEIQDDPIKYLEKTRGKMGMLERQQQLESAGLGDKTLMTRDEAKTFQNTYNNIGIGEVKRNGVIITPEEQFKETLAISKNLMKGNNTLLKKQANLELNGLQAIAVNMEIDDNPYRQQILGYMIKQNENKGKSPAIYDETQVKAKKANFINDGGYGSYLYLTNPQLAEKYAKAGIDIEVYSTNDSKGDKILISDLGKVLKPNYEYKISSDATTILEVDKTKYDAGVLEKQVNTVKRDIGKYFDLEGLTERGTQKLFGGGKGIVAKTNSSEEVEFYFTSQISGERDIFIGAIPFVSLPNQKTAPISRKTIQENITPFNQVRPKFQNLSTFE